MDITIQEVHTYNDLVKNGKAEELILPGVGPNTMLFTSVDEYDKVYFYNNQEGIKIYPGEETIGKIKKVLTNLAK
jgi:hypothetical protein